MNVQTIIQQLPAYKGQERLVKRRQDTFDIMREMMRKHKECIAHYDMLDPSTFWKGNAEQTARYLFDQCKQHIGYVVEPTLSQTVKTPAAILTEGEGDCKHYASFIVGVCCALAKRGYPIRAKYRFASYSRATRNPGHVFAVVTGPDHKEMWVDPVLQSFDQRNPQPVSKQDKLPPMETRASINGLYDISGLPAVQEVPTAGYPVEYTRPITATHWLDEWGGGAHHAVGKAHKKGPKKHHKGLHIKIKNPLALIKKIGGAPSRNAYLGLLKLNVFSLATNINKAVTGHPDKWEKIKQHWRKLGGDTNKLTTAIRAGIGTHNKLHKHSQVKSGLSGMNHGLMDMYPDNFVYSHETVGFAVLAIPALLAAAAPIIAKMKDMLKSLGIGQSQTAVEDAAASADSDAAAAHNSATDTKGDGAADINADGSVDHGEGVTTKVSTDANGKQSISYDVKDPTEGLDSNGNGTTTTSKTKTKTTTTTTDDGGTPDDTSDDTTDTTTTKSVVKTGGGGGLMAYVDQAKDWLGEHKKPILIGAAVIVGAIVVTKIIRSRKPTRRRK
jgi:Transglutaminase-like superfamily